MLVLHMQKDISTKIQQLIFMGGLPGVGAGRPRAHAGVIKRRSSNVMVPRFGPNSNTTACAKSVTENPSSVSNAAKLM